MRKLIKLTFVALVVALVIASGWRFVNNVIKSPAQKAADKQKQIAQQTDKQVGSLEDQIKQVNSLKFDNSNDYQTMVKITAKDLDTVQASKH